MSKQFAMCLLGLASVFSHDALGFALNRSPNLGRGLAQLSSSGLFQTPLRAASSVTGAVSLPPYVQTWLDVELPEGRCVGVSFSEDSAILDMTKDSLAASPEHWMHGAYHPDEIAYGMDLPPRTAKSFWMGRLAMRLALGGPEYAILKDSYGRPRLPPSVCGSISHKKSNGIALVTKRDGRRSTRNIGASPCSLAGVGVDLELTSRPGKRCVGPRTLTAAERESLGSIPGVTADEEVLLRFSLKEAIYKAVHPVLCRYIGFQEVEVTPHSDGTASIAWCLDSDNAKAPANMTAHWRRLDDDGFFVTSASVPNS